MTKVPDKNRFYISLSPSPSDDMIFGITNRKIRTFLENVEIDDNPVIISFSIKFPEDMQ
jgi:hypothetical protein